MSQTLKESQLTTRSARLALPAGTHWRGIDPDTHLGYRKGRRGGRWFVRWYTGSGKYAQATIGTADDVLAEGTLSFEAAVKAARIVVIARRKAAIAAKAGPIVTVAVAVEQYIARRNARATAYAGRKTRSDADTRMTKHILVNAELARTPLCDLKEEQLSEWRAALVGKPASRRRLASDFRAALNAAAFAGRATLPAELPLIIKHGLRRPEIEGIGGFESAARENQILSDEQVRQIVKAAAEIDEEQNWDGDLRRIVLLLASTGARFSQLVRMQVCDVQASRLLIPTSRKGRSRQDGQTPVPVGAEIIQALKPVIAGRKTGDVLLQRWYFRQQGRGKWVRNRREAWGRASDIAKAFRAIALSANLPGITAYALRHSSIVRGLRAGLPIRLVASLHDTSTSMIERYYARHIADGLEELASRAIVSLVS